MPSSSDTGICSICPWAPACCCPCWVAASLLLSALLLRPRLSTCLGSLECFLAPGRLSLFADLPGLLGGDPGGIRVVVTHEQDKLIAFTNAGLGLLVLSRSCSLIGLPLHLLYGNIWLAFSLIDGDLRFSTLIGNLGLAGLLDLYIRLPFRLGKLDLCRL